MKKINIYTINIIFLALILNLILCFFYIGNDKEKLQLIEPESYSGYPYPEFENDPFPQDFFGDYSMPSMWTEYWYRATEEHPAGGQYVDRLIGNTAPLPSQYWNGILGFVPLTWSSFDPMEKTTAAQDLPLIKHDGLIHKYIVDKNSVSAEYWHYLGFYWAWGQYTWKEYDEYVGVGIKPFIYYTSIYNTYLINNPSYKPNYSSHYYEFATQHPEGFDGIPWHTTYIELCSYMADWIFWSYNINLNYDEVYSTEEYTIENSQIDFFFEVKNDPEYEIEEYILDYISLSSEISAPQAYWETFGELDWSKMYWQRHEYSIDMYDNPMEYDLSEEEVKEMNKQFESEVNSDDLILSAVRYGFDLDYDLGLFNYTQRRTASFVNNIWVPEWGKGHGTYNSQFFNGFWNEVYNQIGYKRIINPPEDYEKYTIDDLFSEEYFYEYKDWWYEIKDDERFFNWSKEETRLKFNDMFDINLTDNIWYSHMGEFIQLFKPYVFMSVNYRIDDRPMSLDIIFNQFQILEDWNQSRYVNWLSYNDFEISNWKAMNMDYQWVDVDYNTQEPISQFLKVSFDFELKDTPRTEGSGVKTITLDVDRWYGGGDDGEEFPEWAIITIMVTIVTGISAVILISKKYKNK